MRERAQETGALRSSPTPRCSGSTSSTAACAASAPTRGDVEADVVVIACGVWSPRVARMAGASIPLTPAVHQMIDVGPVPRFLESKTAVEFPIVRDMDTNMYERQDGQGLEVGSYAHRPILHDPDEIPSIEEAALSPTELPFTQEDFELQLEHALELVPEILGDESVGDQVRDQRPPLAHARRAAAARRDAGGEGALVGRRGLGQGRARASASRWPSGWCTASRRSTSSRPTSRASTEQRRRRAHVEGRAAEGFNKTYGIVHPAEQWESNRGVRLSPFYERERELGAVFFEAAALGAAALVRVERAARSRSSAIARRARPSGTRAGGRRSSTPSTSRCASARRCST